MIAAEGWSRSMSSGCLDSSREFPYCAELWSLRLTIAWRKEEAEVPLRVYLDAKVLTFRWRPHLTPSTSGYRFEAAPRASQGGSLSILSAEVMSIHVKLVAFKPDDPTHVGELRRQTRMLALGRK